MPLKVCQIRIIIIRGVVKTDPQLKITNIEEDHLTRIKAHHQQQILRRDDQVEIPAISIWESNICKIKMSKQLFQVNFRARESRKHQRMRRLFQSMNLTNGGLISGILEPVVPSMCGIAYAHAVRRRMKLRKPLF